jgi:hypothetical protein
MYKEGLEQAQRRHNEPDAPKHDLGLPHGFAAGTEESDYPLCKALLGMLPVC